MPDRRTPFSLHGERDTLVEFLEYLRESVIVKMEGLDEQTARLSTVPSRTSLMWIVKHLTRVEVSWFQYAFAGLDVSIPIDEVDPNDNLSSVIAAYESARRISNSIAGEYFDLDQLCKRALTTANPLSLRWLLVHMVEETARHAGHADIIREQIDGQTGR